MFKKWEVEIGTDVGGNFKYFFYKKRALKYIHENKYYQYIELINTFKNKKIIIKSNPDRYTGNINCNHEWRGMRGEIRCIKCNAKINLACEHGGSIACLDCTQNYAKELNSRIDNGKESFKNWIESIKNNKEYCKYCGLELVNNKCQNEYCYLLQ